MFLKRAFCFYNMENLFGEKEYKVLTLWQPWASLLVHGIKKIETRLKPTNWTCEKGIYLIHAASKWSKAQKEICLTEPFLSELEKLNYAFYNSVTLPLGQIIGSIEVTECNLIIINNGISNKATVKVKNKNEHLIVSGNEYNFGDYNIGRYAWLTQNPRVLKTPIPYKGGQGYYQNFNGDSSRLIFL